MRVVELRNALFPDGQLYCIRVAEGLFIDVGINMTDTPYVIDLKGLPVTPGLNPMHVHDRTPGGLHKQDWRHLVRAAKLSGVATVGVQSNTNPPINTYGRFIDKVRMVGGQPIRYRQWFGATARNWREIVRTVYHPLCGIIKVFMGSSEGDGLVDRKRDQRRIFQIAADHDALVGTHCENERIIRRNLRRFPNPTVANHRDIRTVEAAVSSTEQALELQEITGCRLIILHVTTVQELKLCMQAKKAGRTVYIEGCPQYPVFNDKKLLGPDGWKYKINPSFKPEEQAEEYLDLYTTPGVLDVVAPDCAPHTLDEKLQESYFKVPSGAPGLEELFPVSYTTLVRDGGMSLEQFGALTAGNAARIFRLPNGQIKPGYMADLVAFDPNQDRRFEDGKMAAKCNWTMYHGMTFQGVPKFLMVGGKVLLNTL